MLRRFTAALLLIPISVFCAGDALMTSDGSARFIAALRAYDAANFKLAAELLEPLTTSAPECARCAHLLGKSYGRMAQQASWLKAMKLARQTLAALEVAAELAPENSEMLEDLMKFYRTAPGFLGGSEEKADALDMRLQALSHEQPGS